MGFMLYHMFEIGAVEQYYPLELRLFLNEEGLQPFSGDFIRERISAQDNIIGVKNVGRVHLPVEPGIVRRRILPDNLSHLTLP